MHEVFKVSTKKKLSKEIDPNVAANENLPGLFVQCLPTAKSFPELSCEQMPSQVDLHMHRIEYRGEMALSRTLLNFEIFWPGI